MRLPQEQASDQSGAELQSGWVFLAEAFTAQLIKAGTTRSRKGLGNGFLGALGWEDDKALLWETLLSGG